MDRTTLAASIKAATAAFFSDGAPTVEATHEGLTEKQLKGIEIFRSGDWGCQRDVVRKFFRLVLDIGPDVVIGKRKPEAIAFPADVAVVPLSNLNAHSYEIGKVAVSVGGTSYFFDGKGKVGNHLSVEVPSSYRRATDEEIDAYVAGLPEKPKPSTVAQFLEVK